MDKVSMCLDRIRLIKGVNYGVITNEQVSELCEIWALDENQKQEVSDLMKANGIISIPASEIPEKVMPQNNPKSEPRMLSEEELKQIHKERFDAAYKNYKGKIEGDPLLATRYESEIPVFANTVSNMENLKSINIQEMLALATIEVARCRIADKQKIGGCGTYISHAISAFERWLKYVFWEDELVELKNTCINGKEFSDHQKKIIVLVLHNSPKIITRKKLPDFLND